MKLNKFGWTSLHEASYFGKLEIVKYLIEEEGANPNDVNQNGWHSLIFCIMGGQGTNLLRYLLNVRSIDITLLDNTGRSALEYAQEMFPGGIEQELLYETVLSY